MANTPPSGATFAIPKFPAFTTFPSPYDLIVSDPATLSYTASDQSRNVMNGLYATSGSKIFNGDSIGYSTVYCFQQSALPATNFWMSRTGQPSASYYYDPVTGAYNPSGFPISRKIINGTDYRGEYVTITAPYSFVLSAYTIASFAATDWIIAGSNDGGVSFSLVDTVVGANLTSATSYTTFNTTSTIAYSTYIIIITKVPLSGYMGGTSISIWNLYTPIMDFPCFLEGTSILCKVRGIDTYVPIERMRRGDLVKTSLDGYKKLELIGYKRIHNPGTDERIENRLYKCSPSEYSELAEDLYITGYHSILVDSITNQQRTHTIRSIGKIFVTDKKYRLMAFLDDRAKPWISDGIYTIWHISLEHDNVYMNYGVYANGGLLVETSCLDHMRNRSNMTLI